MSRGRAPVVGVTVTVGVGVGLATLLSPHAASASCQGPTVEYEAGEVERGDTIGVWGSAWGDNCYDTGAPPAGEGTLGHSIDGIEIVIVQGAVEHVVARGSADGEYDFAVDVVVPSGLAPGEARVVARADEVPDPEDVTDAPLLVGDSAPDPTDEGVVAFGPVEVRRTTGTDIADAPLWPLVAIVGVVLVGAAGASLTWRRRD